ncbi:MAG: hypothetical protein IJV19_05915 [Prevotella sp.]|nr:hypothetical protein [Prevotella sp.]
MEAGKRIIVNTAAQYVKAIINTCLSLYSVRLILDVLGVSDYGIYSVIGGVIAMIGFITNALVITTQRYLSYYHGKQEMSLVRSMFNNSVLIHIVFAVTLFLLFLIFKNYIVFHLLNIPADRIVTASHVYVISSIILFITIITAPFKAIFIARENIVFISIVEVLYGILKVLVAIFLSWVTYDKLLVYALLMMLLMAVNFSVFAGYSLMRFEECSFKGFRKSIDKRYFGQLMGFAGWTTYGMGAIACRTQGTAVILNRFFGTVMNASYGVANQIYVALNFVSSSVLNAMNPQIMKAAGNGDVPYMLSLSCRQSKFSAMLMMVFSIPVMFELPALLEVWLKETPPDVTMFCRFILIAFICDQLTIGLNAANQAMGKIRTYTLLMFTPKLLYLPVAWLMLHYGGTPRSIMWLFLLVEIGVALMRIPYIKYTLGLSITEYVKNVFVPLIPLACASVLSSWLCVTYLDIPYRFLFTLSVCVLAGILTAYMFTLTASERSYLYKMIRRHGYGNR